LGSPGISYIYLWDFNQKFLWRKLQMKKTLLASAAIAGLVLASAPAQAQMELTIGGHSKNYIGFSDQDDNATSETRDFDMQRETELHFNGESTLDNGLTFGFQVEVEADAEDDSNTIEESYIYMSGTWGRVNLGSEDGAAYLLQVAAPSADSNIDGIRQFVNPVNYTNALGAAGTNAALAAPGSLVGAFGTPFGATNQDGFDYDQDVTGLSEKITYLSPNFNGFQLGASYTPDVGANNSSTNIASGFTSDDAADTLGEAYEIGARYEGVMSNFGYALGAGYTHIELESEGTAAAAAGGALDRNDDFTEWNVGLDIDVGAFGIGAIYKESDTGHDPIESGSDIETFVVGVDYTTGPFKFGASYLNEDNDTIGVGDTLETDRYTGGVVYTAGPGLSFRGSISHIEHEATVINDIEATSVMGGVQINF
jgi:predicted porin